MSDVLVLNADYSVMSIIPLTTISWEEAIKSVYQDKYQVIEEYKEWAVHSPSVTIQVPSVVRSFEYIKPREYAKYSRYNIYLRDNFTCQYCGKFFGPDNASQLTLDHVNPVARGGTKKWENLVAACTPCNMAKSHHMHIKPKYMPYRPYYRELVRTRKKYSLTVAHESWLTYLNWSDKVNIRPNHHK